MATTNKIKKVKYMKKLLVYRSHGTNENVEVRKRILFRTSTFSFVPCDLYTRSFFIYFTFFILFVVAIFSVVYLVVDVAKIVLKCFSKPFLNQEHKTNIQEHVGMCFSK